TAEKLRRWLLALQTQPGISLEASRRLLEVLQRFNRSLEQLSVSLSQSTILRTFSSGNRASDDYVAAAAILNQYATCQPSNVVCVTVQEPTINGDDLPLVLGNGRINLLAEQGARSYQCAVETAVCERCLGSDASF